MPIAGRQGLDGAAVGHRLVEPADGGYARRAGIDATAALGERGGDGNETYATPGSAARGRP